MYLVSFILVEARRPRDRKEESERERECEELK